MTGRRIADMAYCIMHRTQNRPSERPSAGFSICSTRRRSVDAAAVGRRTVLLASTLFARRARRRASATRGVNRQSQLATTRRHDDQRRDVGFRKHLFQRSRDPSLAGRVSIGDAPTMPQPRANCLLSSPAAAPARRRSCRGAFLFCTNVVSHVPDVLAPSQLVTRHNCMRRSLIRGIVGHLAGKAAGIRWDHARSVGDVLWGVRVRKASKSI
jgi:hypothetical protein